ncbi:MAG: helix-turn-helix domain-containing protein [Sulfolobaceae archaeon]|nr:helix-turn-helix domain-containing protein [Sulfolobaceae archaeon]
MMITPLLIILDILAGIIAFFITRDLMIWNERRKRSALSTSEELIDTDLKVLKAISEGAGTLNQIMKYTGLPKSTAYKSLKRLLKEGKIEKIVENGKVRYVVKSKSDEKGT